MKTLTKGYEPNLIRLYIDNIDIKPCSEMRSGMIQDGLIVKIVGYHVDDLLCQMLEDYGEEELIKRIKALE